MTQPSGIVIAIDGPSGAGKGTVARTVAARLGYRHVDTGAMYRAVAWLASSQGVDLSEQQSVATIAERAEFELDGVVRIDGHDVTTAIRTPAIDRAAAAVAQNPLVRDALVRRQRSYGERGGIVMEGRDIGTVVFPAAELKVYLDASAEERARRRAGDSAHTAGQDTTGLAGIVEALEARDLADRTRTTSPLSMASDAVYIDTTEESIAVVVERVLALAEASLSARPRS